MSTGAKVSNEHRTEQAQGGNLVGKAPSAPLRTVPAFQGKSGQAANQETFRKDGK
jgi:hypothetical protein